MLRLRWERVSTAYVGAVNASDPKTEDMEPNRLFQTVYVH